MMMLRRILLLVCLAVSATLMAEDNKISVKVTPVADGIFHVEKMAPGLPGPTGSEARQGQRPDRQKGFWPSLTVIPQLAFTDYQTSETATERIITTKRLTAHINKLTGTVTFTDADGNTVLAEHQGGCSFTPYATTQIHADGTPEEYHGWTIHQEFESPADEAFYGLGQHQADEWNYKGRNEELFQYNTKVSVPFIVSNKGYGLLMDNYSMMRWGNPRDYEQLHRVFRLYDREGREGALTGIYKVTAKDKEDVFTRREDSLYFENLKSARNLPKDIPLQRAEVTYEGWLEPMTSGTYHFSHYYSGYQQITITDEADHECLRTDTLWRTAWNPNARKFMVTMQKGQRYHIRLTWRPDGGEAYCGLRAYAPVADEVQGRQSWWSEMAQQLDYYVIAGPTADDIISGYRRLTGKAQIMPRWLYGFWQSRERYKTQDEITDALRGFRQRHLPIDNIVMDWNYWKPDSWGAFTFEESRFPSPQKMIDDIHAMHAKFMISCWPKYYLTVDNFKELNNKGMMYQQSIKDSIYDWLGYKYAFYDAYNPEARRIFWRQLYEKLGVMGVDSWWMDASEPNVRDCTDIPYRKLLCGPTYYGSSDEYFNAYSIVNAEAIYDGQRGYESGTDWNSNGYGNNFSPENKRVFLLTRNGFLGQQRYSTATWSGDIGTRWEDLKAQITAGLNFSISGIPYWSQDIGGFSVERRYENAQRLFDKTGEENADLKEWRELNVRWHQYGMWVPMYRVHGQFPFREPWNIAPEGTPAYDAITSCLRLRYHLLPYIYSVAAKVHFDDYTMMRPLVMDFDANDVQVRDNGYQFMMGPSFMVCPVYEYGARQREVYLPVANNKENTAPRATGWYDASTGKYYAGGQIITVDAPYERIPVFVRAGSIIPVGPALEYTDERDADTLRIYIYEGADGDFTLYEDEGTNYGYEAGRYAKIRMTWDDHRHQLTINPREGSFPGMLQERVFVVVRVNKDNQQGFDAEAAGKIVRYKGKRLTLKK